MASKSQTVNGLQYLTYASVIAVGWGFMSLIIFLYYYINDSFTETIFWLAGFYLFLYLVGVVLSINRKTPFLQNGDAVLADREVS